MRKVEEELLNNLSEPYKKPRDKFTISAYCPMFILIGLTLLYTERQAGTPELILFIIFACKSFYYFITGLLLIGILILVSAFTSTEFRDKYWAKFPDVEVWERDKTFKEKVIHVINNSFHWSFVGFVYYFMADYYFLSVLIVLEFLSFLYKIVIQTSYHEYKAIMELRS